MSRKYQPHYDSDDSDDDSKIKCGTYRRFYNEEDDTLESIRDLKRAIADREKAERELERALLEAMERKKREEKMQRELNEERRREYILQKQLYEWENEPLIPKDNRQNS